MSKERKVFQNRILEDRADMVTDEGAYAYMGKPPDPDIVTVIRSVRSHKLRGPFPVGAPPLYTMWLRSWIAFPPG